MRRRDKHLLWFALSAFAGILVLVGGTAWFLWNKTIEAEERALEEVAQTLGQNVERIIVDARNMLHGFNNMAAAPCSEAHLEALGKAAFAAPHILAIGYWEAAERRCGAGFTEAIELKPEKADRIYDSGVIAWWPGPQTEAEGVQLFVMRYGRHDVVIDPRTLLETTAERGRRIGLWVEGLRMAAVPPGAELPAPQKVAAGLSMDNRNDRMLARFTLGTVFPIDVVVAEPMGQFWQRYWPTIGAVSSVVLVLSALWLYGVIHYTRNRLSLASELRDSLINGQFSVHYQPIVEVASGRCVGAEALARWTREGGEVITPESFIPLAESAGLVPQITLAILDATLRDLGHLLRTAPHLQIHLNLAPEDVERPEFTNELSRRIAAAGVPARSIKLEITERALINSDKARKLISGFRQQGHEVAIDDFGTGYSSLAYLEHFELDTLKIDKSFVDAIGTEAVTSHVIGHVIHMAQSLRLDTVAEGVETPAQAEWLRAQGVSYAQGYLYSKALSARHFRTYLRTRRVSNVYPLKVTQAHGGG